MTFLNLASGVYVLDQFDNLDPCLDPPWHFQDGLGQYPDGSVEGITCSHGLSQLPIQDWDAAFKEFARVLQPSGVIRVQDEWANNEESRWYPHGFAGVAVLTTPELVVEHMLAVRLTPHVLSAETTLFKDRSLIQRLHNGEPHSFACEGVKPE